MTLRRCRIAAMLALIPLLLSESRAADHLDSPSVGSDGRVDINDLYAFQSPANPNMTVLMMTVNPLAGVLSETSFHPSATYEFHIDNNGDAVSDLSYTVYFSSLRRGSQNVILLKQNGSIAASGKTGMTLNVSGGGKLRAGLYEDPFFFDLNGFNDGFSFDGTDFFAGMNVNAIILEVPSSALAGPNLAVWARTTVGGNQFDRMGRPAINTVLIPSGRKDEFNTANPVFDYADFHVDVEAAITSLGNGANAAGLASVLLPDVLTVDVSSSAGFLNGRKPADDVIDAELNLLSNGAVTTDLVNANDKPFPAVFPYLAAPN
ncbi:MAG: DUF4331 family protein [Planctomycetaceae bacterium]